MERLAQPPSLLGELPLSFFRARCGALERCRRALVLTNRLPERAQLGRSHRLPPREGLFGCLRGAHRSVTIIREARRRSFSLNNASLEGAAGAHLGGARGCPHGLTRSGLDLGLDLPARLRGSGEGGTRRCRLGACHGRLN